MSVVVETGLYLTGEMYRICFRRGLLRARFNGFRLDFAAMEASRNLSDLVTLNDILPIHIHEDRTKCMKHFNFTQNISVSYI